ncbi:MAG: hypothetical protein HY038_00350 [Nitrospirae bacterium]|nr:hypothetical protein [Nitrospirota bacterium]
MSEAHGQYSGLLRRATAGAILGTVVGTFEQWFFKHDLAHFFAAVLAGALYLTTLAVLTDRFQLAGGKTLLGAVSGFLAAIVWWSIAGHTVDAFAVAAVSGICFGSVYVWSEVRKSP